MSSRFAPWGLLLGSLLLPGAASSQTCYVLRPEPQQHNFALVIDRSGSMAGVPLQQAITGAQLFVDHLQAGDRAAVIAFDTKVKQLTGMTADRAELRKAIGAIDAGEATALYDAIVRAANVVLAQQGARIIVFLTDGADTGSLYTLPEIASLGLSEGIFFYGIGLGQVDTPDLLNLTQATGGSLEVTSDPHSLADLYQRVLTGYYRDFADKMAQTGAYAIRSLPSGREVWLAGKSLGRTPVKVDNVPPGEYALEIAFKRGTWRCHAPAQSGYRTIVDAREDEVGFDLWIASHPHEAVVFLDGNYVGTTGFSIVDTEDRNWGKRAKKDPAQLRISLVPKGPHALRLLALPDFDFGPEQQIAFEFDMAGRERVLQVDILSRRILVDDGTVMQQSLGEQAEEQMQELDKELENADSLNKQ